MLRFALAIVIILMTSITAVAAETTYRVKKGNNLTGIAKKINKGLDEMLYANESFLKKKYEEVCGRLSDDFKKRKTKEAKKGGKFFCNDRFYRPYGNTLLPGWRLVIPTAIAPATIQETVRVLPGKNVALVIDDTGSMGDKRARVAGFYLSALHQQKKIIGVYLYADGRVRRYEAGGVRDLQSVLQTRGSRENTLDALLQAAKDRPDAIILVTDEQGDDWGDWKKVAGLPPIIAHCLPLDRNASNLIDCRATLKRLVATVPGSRYVEGFDGK